MSLRGLWLPCGKQGRFGRKDKYLNFKLIGRGEFTLACSHRAGRLSGFFNCWSGMLAFSDRSVGRPDDKGRTCENRADTGQLRV